MEQQKDLVAEYKRNFNIAFYVMLVHQRALIIPMREKMGKEALGLVCGWAFVLMCAWAAWSGDPFMWVWIGGWVGCLIRRKMETAKLAKSGVRIHSQHDGWPRDAIRFCRTENQAKLVVEPILVGAIGVVLLLIYRSNDLPVYGLPYFFLLGIASLTFVEKVKQQIWQKRLQGMSDARVEQEQLVEQSRQQYGE